MNFKRFRERTEFRVAMWEAEHGPLQHRASDEDYDEVIGATFKSMLWSALTLTVRPMTEDEKREHDKRLWKEPVAWIRNDSDD